MFLSCLCTIIPLNHIHGFDIVKKNGMGIYLLHPMLLYMLYYCYDESFNPYLFCVCSVILVLILSYFMCMILKALKLNILLGE